MYSGVKYSVNLKLSSNLTLGIQLPIVVKWITTVSFLLLANSLKPSPIIVVLRSHNLPLRYSRMTPLVYNISRANSVRDRSLLPKIYSITNPDIRRQILWANFNCSVSCTWPPRECMYENNYGNSVPYANKSSVSEVSIDTSSTWRFKRKHNNNNGFTVAQIIANTYNTAHMYPSVDVLINLNNGKILLLPYRFV